MAETSDGITSSNDLSVANIKPALTTEELVGIPIEDLLIRLNTSQQGLNAQEATERLEVYGPNVLAREHKHSAASEFLSHFKSPLIIILLIAGIITGYLGLLSGK